jgi:hypothetical protein
MKDSVGGTNWSSVSQACEPSPADKPQSPRSLEQTHSEPARRRSSSAADRGKPSPEPPHQR